MDALFLLCYWDIKGIKAYGHKDFFPYKSTNLFTIPKSDLFSIADDMKPGICIHSSTSLC